MKSKASYFSISVPLLWENLRRFWSIPVLSFLVYFFSGVFPILMSYSHLNDMASYIQTSLKNQQFFYMAAHLFFPIITSVAIFRYLQSISSVAVIHSMPFTRKKLYHTNALSGLILFLSPIVANGILLLLLSKPTYLNWQGTDAAQKIDVFTRTAVFGWLWQSIVIVLFVYAIAIFAGILTGNVLLHFICATGFNFLVPALYAIFTYYFQTYLYGFNTGSAWSETLTRLSPYLNIANGSFTKTATLVYLGIIVVLYLLSMMLYDRRKLERATDSFVFGFMNPFISYLVAFLGMSFLGAYFTVFGDGSMYRYAGYASGTILAFIIGQMIVRKTPRVFNKDSLKSFAIFTLLAILFLSALEFDLTGFEKRIPTVLSIKEVSFQAIPNYQNAIIQSVPFKDPDNFRAIQSFHQEVIQQKEYLDQSKITNTFKSNSIEFSYLYKNNRKLARSYIVPYELVKNSTNLKAIFESSEYRENLPIEQINFTEFRSFRLYSSSGIFTEINITDRKSMASFLSALLLDLKQQSYESMTSLKQPYTNVELYYSYYDKNSGSRGENVLSVQIRKDFKNTIAWIDTNGYREKLEANPDQVRYITVQRVKMNDQGIIAGPNTYSIDAVEKYKETSQYALPTDLSRIPTQTKELMVITDPKQIPQIMEDVDLEAINYQNNYVVNVVLEEAGTFGVISGYFNQDIPPFVQEYFQ